MEFEEILRQWESGAGKPERKKNNKPEGDEVPSNWLDFYPPDQSRIDEKNSYRPPPISEGRSKWFNKMFQDTLDLHGMTQQEASDALAGFLQSMKRRGLRKGLIIHGKGLHSSEGSKLYPMVRVFLESSVSVGQFGHPKARHGGKGATWFILKPI